MYSRKIEGRDRNFGVSGKLWNGVLVMYDRETDSLWTQVDGRAIQGDAIGTRLEHVDSVFTTWENWVALHPNTEVLARDPDAEPLSTSHYADYLDDPDKLFFPELGEGIGGIAPKDLVFGVTVAGESWAVSESVLAKDGLVQASIGGALVTVVYDSASLATRAFTGGPGGRPTLSKVIPGVSPLERVLDVVTGEPFAPAEMRSLRLDRAYWYAWARSHSGSRILAD